MEAHEEPSEPNTSRETLLAGISLFVLTAILLFAFLFRVSCFYVMGVMILGFFFVLWIADLQKSRDRLGFTVILCPTFLLFCAFSLAWIEDALEASRHGWGAIEFQVQQKQIVMALQAYHEEHGHLPPAVVFGPKGEPFLSWRVLLLPYLDQEKLYKRFRLDEPWNSPENSKLLPEIPSCFQPLRLDRSDSLNSTFHQVFVGPGAAFEEKRGLNFERDFPDGLDQTIILVEAFEPVPWTSPRDLPFDLQGELPLVGRPRKNRLGRIAWNGALVLPSHFQAAMASKAILGLANSPDMSYLRAWVTRNSGDKAED
jgi:hypothetical protein